MISRGAFAPIIRIQAGDFDVSAETKALTSGRADVGALVAFVGLCRDEGGTLAALEIERYAGMAEAELARVAGEAAARWPLLGLAIVHRFGVIEAGGRIVLAAAAAAHRGEAFEAANFLMDYLKTRAPFWKRPHRPDGTLGEWVEPRGEDDLAAARWRDGGS
jgi:molybdopterin synthase catalytic subunit